MRPPTKKPMLKTPLSSANHLPDYFGVGSAAFSAVRVTPGLGDDGELAGAGPDSIIASL